MVWVKVRMMQMKIDGINPEAEARKPWVEPEFEVLGAEEAQSGATPPIMDGGSYS